LQPEGHRFDPGWLHHPSSTLTTCNQEFHCVIQAMRMLFNNPKVFLF
jgi:hypothetical protein